MEDSAGGGDRLFAQFEIQRTRSSTTTALATFNRYIRNQPANAANTSTAFSAIEREARECLVVTDDAQQGDVYRVRARLQMQLTVPRATLPAIAARTLRFASADNRLDIHGTKVG